MSRHGHDKQYHVKICHKINKIKKDFICFHEERRKRMNSTAVKSVHGIQIS